MMKPPSKFLGVLLVVLVLVGLLYLLPNRFVSASKDQVELDLNKVVSQWGDCSFEKPTVKSLLTVMGSKNTIVSGKDAFTDEQKNSYATNLLGMFEAYSSGSYERFRTWRFPADHEPRLEFVDSVRPTIVSGYKVPPNGIYVRDAGVIAKVKSLLVPVAPAEPEKVFELFVRLQSLGTFYNGFWKGYCLSNMQIRIDDLTTLPNEIYDYQFGFTDDTSAHPHSVKAGIANIGLATHPGFFTFKESPAAILREHGKIRMAHALIMVDMADGRGAGPVVVQAYWAPGARTWLPSAIAEGNLWKLRSIQLCF